MYIVRAECPVYNTDCILGRLTSEGFEAPHGVAVLEGKLMAGAVSAPSPSSSSSSVLIIES